LKGSTIDQGRQLSESQSLLSTRSFVDRLTGSENVFVGDIDGRRRSWWTCRYVGNGDTW